MSWPLRNSFGACNSNAAAEQRSKSAHTQYSQLLDDVTLPTGEHSAGVRQSAGSACPAAPPRHHSATHSPWRWRRGCGRRRRPTSPRRPRRLMSACLPLLAQLCLPFVRLAALSLALSSFKDSSSPPPRPCPRLGLRRLVQHFQRTGQAPQVSLLVHGFEVSRVFRP